MKKTDFDDLIKKFESIGLTRSQDLIMCDDNGNDIPKDDDFAKRFEFWFITVDFDSEEQSAISVLDNYNLVEGDRGEAYVFQGWLIDEEADFDATYDQYLNLYEQMKTHQELWTAR